ncbi:MAG: hypothetical protein M1832_001505 [Thelocarpon impressellum]|nr:MAG: hypothetical protein M1832_001505 [Thelocarpon impressellum]
MVLAHLAGVKVFATGGLGGVHRDGENSMDVSADLTELGRTPIAVISSGCKSFLDIRRTLEYLETEGVGVVTFADGRGQGSAVDFPAFWTRDSGFQSPMVVENETEAAAVIYAQSSLSISSGLLFANSIPAEHSIPKETMEKAINAALQAAHDEGATGKDNTPFVLNKIKELTTASPTSSPVLPQHHTSNPSIITQALGGVGHNVAYAAHLLGASVRLCSAVGNDFGGTAALSLMAQKGMEIVGTKVMGLETGSRTAQYVAVNDTNRSLVLAMADISILERVGANFEDDWKPVMERSRPRWLVVDANWEAGALRKWIIQARASRASVAFEPVSAAKATRLFTKEVPNLEALGVFPHHHVDLATPNAIELAAMHNSARQNEILERQDWWQLIDSLGISSGGARDKLVSATNAGLVDRGVPQQSIQLLPFVPCIVTKLGPEGVLLTQLLSPDDHRLNSPSAAPHILSRSHDGNEAVGGVYMRHFPSAEVVPDEDVVSVNGVGDTFMGVLVAGLARGTMHDLERLIEVAQRASVMTLKSKEGVHPDLGLLSAEVSRC